MKSYARAPNPFMSAQPCFDRISSVQFFFLVIFTSLQRAKRLTTPELGWNF